VVDRGKRVVVVMQQRPPALIRLGAPEAFGVALEIVPPHQQQVTVFGFEATPQLVLLVARAGGDDGLRLAKARPEGVALAGTDLEDGDF
jgi:hypothetical protein